MMMTITDHDRDYEMMVTITDRDHDYDHGYYRYESYYNYDNTLDTDTYTEIDAECKHG